MIWNHTQHCIWQGAWDCPQQSLSYTPISRQYLRLNDRTKLYCVGGPCAVNCCRDVMAAAAAAEAMMGGDAATTLNCVWLMAVLARRYVIWWPVNHCRTKFSRAVRRFGTYSCKLCGLDWLSGNLSSLSVYVFVLHWLHWCRLYTAHPAVINDSHVRKLNVLVLNEHVQFANMRQRVWDRSGGTCSRWWKMCRTYSCKNYDKFTEK